MARPSHSLPDEIVKEIIAPRLSAPDALFRDNSVDVSPFSTPSPHPCSNILVVCKQWMRVATPLLYNFIVLRSNAQASSLAHALKRNPDFGQYIMRLRLEGGFGLAVEKVIRLAPNVRELVLCLAIWSHDNVSGLINSLHLVQPTHLFVMDGAKQKFVSDIISWKESKAPENTSTKKLTKKLCECIETHWKRLEFCDFPYDDYNEPVLSRGRVIASALACSDSIRVISVRHGFRMDDIEILSLIKNLQHISVKLHPAARRSAKEPRVRPEIQSNERLLKLIRYERPALAIKNTGAVSTELNPFYTPLANVSEDIREYIWGHVIMFACAPDQLREVSPSFGRCLAVRLTWMRRRLTKVSKLFYRLAEPYLYTDPGMPKTSHMLAFARTISERPSLASHIRILAVPVNPIFGGGGKSGAAEAEQLLLKIIKQATNLTEIEQINDWSSMGQYYWDWNILDSFTSSRMTRLGGLLVAAPTSKTAFLSLAKFANLTELELYCQQGKYFSSDDDPPFPADCLHRLEKLTCSEKKPEFPYLADETRWNSTSLLDIILPLELPSLRSLTMKNKMMRSSISDLQSGDGVSGGYLSDGPPDFKEFVIKHGWKLVCMEVGSLGTWSPLPHCPNLKNMTMVVGEDPPSSSFFDCGKHPSLEKITFAYLYEGKGFHGEPKWPQFFDNVNFGAFPSLELHIPACKWPTNDREIKQGKNVWGQRAERLLKEYNVKITDEKGVQWVPRLGARAKKVKKKAV